MEKRYLNTFLKTLFVSFAFVTSVTMQANAQYIPANGEQCFANPDDPDVIGAQSIWTSVWSTDLNTGLMTLRITLAPTFVDNTYGNNTIGWPSDNHTFNHLKGSDHLQIALYDANNSKQLEFKMDYIDTDGSAPSGYSCQGLDANGGMVSGNANYVDMLF
jgi:hypothetical protein